MAKMGEKVGDLDFHLRSLTSNARDSSSASDPASDPHILQSVRKIYEICKEEGSEDLVARAHPQINKLFQRSVLALPNSQTSNGLLLLTILQFFLDFGEVVLHDADPSLRTFFRSCLSREFADPVVAEATLDFINRNKKKFLTSFPALLPQFFPLLLKLIAWNGTKLENSFLMVLPTMMSPGSFLPLFPSLLDLPILVIALEKVEKSSGTLIGSSIASIQKSKAPEMLLALMDEAYTGSTIEDRGTDSGSDDSSAIDVADPVFLDLLKDENDGIAERHWTSAGMAAALQAAINTAQSVRLKQALQLAPRFLSVYFEIALQDASDSLLCALLPLLMSRNATVYPDKIFSFEVRRRIIDFMLAVFQRSPDFVALLKKPIIDRLGEAYDNPEKTELALHLCWAIGEHGAGGVSHKNAARELFESLELLLYENLSSSLDASIDSMTATSRKSSQARLLCFAVTAIAKLATCHRELLPRARVSLAKVARSQNSDKRVWRRARDCLGLMNEPAICSSVLGPSSGGDQGPGTVKWNEGGSKMISHLPFYILSEQEGPPFHDFSFVDILRRPDQDPVV
ncbi:AP-5 complex subunit zeta-1 [Dioscorea cayenensis subsp. rotundata]|uniref:AP-5 complex subunit zeta-1 n=1 Tax=Dioscorea cayennensis subsp. rotundata TaxID=55577 RepID=A0AB40BVM5_DIOCR|nr:AP-5 complex subunit zeta-1 [Dioscorea cayenensis subsp. rotundata]